MARGSLCPRGPTCDSNRQWGPEPGACRNQGSQKDHWATYPWTASTEAQPAPPTHAHLPGLQLEPQAQLCVVDDGVPPQLCQRQLEVGQGLLEPAVTGSRVTQGRGVEAGVQGAIREGTRSSVLTSPAGSWPRLAGRSQPPGRRPWSLPGQMPGNKNARGMPRSVTCHPVSQMQFRQMTSDGAKTFHRPCDSHLRRARGPQTSCLGVHRAIQVPSLVPTS